MYPTIFLYFFRRCVFGVQNHLEDGCAWLGIADGPHLSHANEHAAAAGGGWMELCFFLTYQKRKKKKFVSF